MDASIVRSLIKWPDVPRCFGWLALDRRGQWRMRNEYAQHHQLPGSVIEHIALKEFVARNYARDEQGRFFFQNGPQRVFITLDATPWIVRLIPNGAGLQFQTQCQNPMLAQGALCDESGNIYITGLINQTQCEGSDALFVKKECISVALLHDHDLDLFSSFAKMHEDTCSYKGSWSWDGEALPLDPIHSQELEKRFDFIKTPRHY